MSDSLGRITVPDVAASGTFPAIIDWGHSFTYEIPVAVHPIENRTANKQIEQRFKLGPGTRRFSLHSTLNETRRAALVAFLDAREGPYQPFTLNWPNEAGTSTTAYTVCFTEAFTLDRVTDALTTTGLELAEVKTASFPTYTVNSTQTRFPSAGLPAALLAQEQELIPLIHIKVKEAGVTDNIFLSDRRCTVGGQLYQARLIDWDGITQELGGSADSATFRFGNADRVMSLLANDTLLDHALLSFSVYHVGTGIKLDLWAGEVVTWQGEAAPVFSIQCGDPARELTQAYPLRRPCRQCDKPYGNAAAGCPALLGNPAGLDTTHFPTADEDICDHTYDGANGCMAHSGAAAPNTMRSFHGIFAKSQKALVKFTGPSKGVRLTSCSQLDETIWSQEVVIPEIHTDVSMPVKCLLVSGRDENDYYSGLGIVGEGPLQFSPFYKDHTLDGQPGHDPNHWPWWGCRVIAGTDPAGATEYFSIGQKDDHTAGDFRKVFDGTNTYDKIYLAGTAFIDIRRKDAKGLQLTPITEHQMQTRILWGLGGYAWTAPGTRVWQSYQTNPVWVAVNKYLRARGAYFATAAVQETYFDCVAEIAAAAICNLSVPKLVGTGYETQFKFLGQLRDQKPLRDWLQEILNNCLGWFCFSNGKLKIGIRENSSAVEAYTTGNIIADSLVLTPLQPGFNRLIGQFANCEILDDAGYPQWSEDNIPVQDISHAAFIAGANGVPQYLSSTMPLSGCATRSQTARVVCTRLREELGGISDAEWKAARNIVFKTTILGLHSEVGQVDSLTHPDMPGGAGEFRCTAWRLNPDWSVEIAGRSTTDSMYDLTVGPKPADVVPSAVPGENIVMPFGQVWHPYEEQPASGDPYYSTDEWGFKLQQWYTMMADGRQAANVRVTGKFPVNTFLGGSLAPTVSSITPTAGGGTLPAGAYYFRVMAYNATGFSAPCWPVLAELTATGHIHLGMTWPDGTWTGYVLLGGSSAHSLCVQAQVAGALPAAITISAPLKPSTWSAHPDIQKVRIRGKEVFHSGPIGWAIQSVTAPNTIVCGGLIDLGGSPLNFAGRWITVINDASDGSARIWNFTILTHNPATGTITVTPNCVIGGDPANSVQAGDVLILRHKATAFGASYIEDSAIQNYIYPAGMTASEEIGRVVRITKGTGKGQTRRISANTAVRLTVEAPWDTIPDATSSFIVEAGAWTFTADSDATANNNSAQQIILDLPVANYMAHVVLIQGSTVDRWGNEPPEAECPMREIYVLGAGDNERTVTANSTQLPTDQTVLIDTTGGTVTYTLMPHANWIGRAIFVQRMAGANAGTIACAGAEQTTEGPTITLAANGDGVTLKSLG